MNKLITILFLTSFLALLSLSGKAQDFTSDITSGCNPILVEFSATSGTADQWIFGNGNSSPDSVATASYTNPGTYDVTMITTGGDTVFKPGYITVFANPQAGFIADTTSGCVPFTVNFTDTTIKGDAGIESWSWDFGDGYPPATSQDPSHIFTLAGTFTVKLTVVDSNGCKDTTSKVNLIQTSQIPNAEFSVDKTDTCGYPFEVNFTNSSTSADSLTYLWDFGDGTSSSDEHPSHIYDTLGNYTVKLTVLTPTGCKDSVVYSSLINIEETVADFTMSDTAVCTNNAVIFMNNSSGASTYFWDFGDGFTSTLTNTSHSYSNSGTYTVTLIASGGPGCADTITKDVYVEDINAGFTADTTYSCELPFTVNFTDTSGNAVDWQWDFGDGNTATVQNPSHTYLTDSLHTVSLTVTSPQGCKDIVTLTDYIEIILPVANFSMDTTKGCIDLDVNFTDSSTSNEPITNWDWDFGDGFTSTSQNPTHTYTTAGDTFVTLVITNSLGCTSTISKDITPGDHQVPGYEVAVDTSCARDQVQFTDTSSDQNLIDEWIWVDMGDGAMENGPNPAHMYMDTGHMEVTYVIGYNGCYDTLILDSVVYIEGPIIRAFSEILLCDTLDPAYQLLGSPDPDSLYKYRWFAHDDIFAATGWDWDFTGSGIDSTVSYNFVTSDTDTVFYNYPQASGDYLVTLNAYNDSTGCDYTQDINVFIRDIQAKFSRDTTYGCPGLEVTFDPSASKDDTSYFYEGIEGHYQWNFGDGSTFFDIDTNIVPDTITNGPISHIFYQKGTFDTRMLVQDINGCWDSIIKPITIHRPNAEFTGDTVAGCVPLEVTFSDQSLPDGFPIVGWDWDFGNTQNGTGSVVTATYNQPGNYTVILTITDSLGCTDTEVNGAFVKATQPVPAFSAATTACEDSSITFTNNSTGDDLSYLWLFGDGATSTAENPVHSYSDTGYFSVTLTITDSVGCDSTIVKTDYIHIQANPDAGFFATPTETDCYPVDVAFTDTSVSDYIVSWDWSLGDQSPVVDNPQVFKNFNEPGSFTITLTVTTSYGCQSTAVYNDYININGPIADFDLAPNPICKGDTVTFTIKDTMNVEGYTWDFGDGSTMSNVPVAQHVYDNMPVNGNSYFPTLIYWTTGEECKRSVTATVSLYDAFADFIPSTIAGCPPLTVDFTDQSQDPVTWNWDFGGDGTSTVQNPQHTFNEGGNYNVRLIITESVNGCKDTAFKPIMVHPQPQITLGDDAVICRGESMLINASGAGSYSWLWQPSAGLSDTTVANPVATPLSSTIYGVTATDVNGCTTQDDIAIDVQQPFNLTYGNDTTIIIGEIAYLWANGSENVTYSWTPEAGLSCSDCPNPSTQPLETTTYTVTIEDPYNCFSEKAEITVEVVDSFTVDVPTAFSPNGDGRNDVIYVKGWGIKTLHEFKIYNRWGQLVYENPGDIDHGWDGNFKGKPQNIDTYVWILKAESYGGEMNPPETRKGYITLLR